MNLTLVELAELDSPNSITDMHPYGRRRANGRRTGVVLLRNRMLLCSFIMGLKVNNAVGNILMLFHFFTKKGFVVTIF